MHKALLNRESLKAQDGVKYFRDTFSPHLSKELRVFSSGFDFDFEDDPHQRDARHLPLTDDCRAAKNAHKVCTVSLELHFLPRVKQELMSKNSIQHPSCLHQEGPQLIHHRDLMPSVEQNAQKACKPNAGETSADNPSHNDAFLRAHKPPNIPPNKLSSSHHRSLPNSKKFKKAQPNIHTSRGTHQNFPARFGTPKSRNHKQLRACKHRDRCDDHVWDSTTRLQLFLVQSRHTPTP